MGQLIYNPLKPGTIATLKDRNGLGFQESCKMGFGWSWIKTVQVLNQKKKNGMPTPNESYYNQRAYKEFMTEIK